MSGAASSPRSSLQIMDLVSLGWKAIGHPRSVSTTSSGRRLNQASASRIDYNVSGHEISMCSFRNDVSAVDGFDAFVNRLLIFEGSVRRKAVINMVQLCTKVVKRMSS